MQDYRKLKVWQKSHSLVLRIYNATCTFPEQEKYGLTSQMRRAAVSVPANIAEGCARSGRIEFRQFLHISAGSASELDYLLLLGRDLHFLTEKQYEMLYSSLYEVRRMLTGLIERLSTSDPNPLSPNVGNVARVAHPHPTPLSETKN
jgi:four helix bundle protein